MFRGRNASQTHGMRCTRHTWTTANLNNIPSINVRYHGTQTGAVHVVGRVPVPLTHERAKGKKDKTLVRHQRFTDGHPCQRVQEDTGRNQCHVPVQPL